YVFGWWKIFGMIEASSCNIDLVRPSVGLVGQRCSTVIAEYSPRTGLRLIPARPSLHELKLRPFYYDPRYRLSSGGAPAVGTMTVRANTHLRPSVKADLAAITATGDLLIFHCHQWVPAASGPVGN